MNISFYYIRHGQTDWNLEGRVQGIVDIPLNTTGQEQARQACEKLVGLGITKIVSSPLKRAFETANIIAEFLDLTVETDKRLQERSFGSFQGQLNILKRLNLKESESIDPHLPDDAETFENVTARSTEAVEYHLKENPDDIILFVAHGQVFRALTQSLCGEVKNSDNAVPYRFDQPSQDLWCLSPI